MYKYKKMRSNFKISAASTENITTIDHSSMQAKHVRAKVFNQ